MHTLTLDEWDPQSMICVPWLTSDNELRLLARELASNAEETHHPDEDEEYFRMGGIDGRYEISEDQFYQGLLVRREWDYDLHHIE